MVLKNVVVFNVSDDDKKSLWLIVDPTGCCPGDWSLKGDTDPKHRGTAVNPDDFQFIPSPKKD